MATEVTATLPDPTFLDRIWDSIATPGAGPGLIAAVNASLLAVIGVAGYYYFQGYLDEHMIVLLVLAAGLLASFNWFISMIGSAQQKEHQPLVTASPVAAPAEKEE